MVLLLEAPPGVGNTDDTGLLGASGLLAGSANAGEFEKHAKTANTRRVLAIEGMFTSRWNLEPCTRTQSALYMLELAIWG